MVDYHESFNFSNAISSDPHSELLAASCQVSIVAVVVIMPRPEDDFPPVILQHVAK